ncbi:MAG: pilus assembly protein [Anaerolineae bacterium]|nr:pilus assembly protein [Gemmatimonadaceae bacterium]
MVFRTSITCARRGSRRGAVLVMVALLLTVLLGFGAFAIDLSQVMAHRSELQRSADAAVVAAVRQLTTTQPDSADEVAIAYSAANLVNGSVATVDSVQYGRWNDASSTFTPFPCSTQPGGCGLGDAFSADAFRIRLRSVTPSIFAQVLGVVSSTVQAEATGWTSNNVEIADCVKPFAIPYQVLTATLNRVIGTTLSLQRNLNTADIRAIRSDALQAQPFCLKEGETCNLPPSPGQPVGSFLIVDLNAGDGPGAVSGNIGPGCVSGPLGPDSVMSVQSGNFDLFTEVQQGRSQWCNQYGTFPCKMKVVLYDAAGGSAAQCVPEVTGTEQCVVHRVASIVITGPPRSEASSNPALPPRVVLDGYFTVLVDEGMIGSTKPSTLTRPILVH